MSFTGNGITSCYPDEVENFISITVLSLPDCTTSSMLGGVLGWALSEHNARLANVESAMNSIAEAQTRLTGAQARVEGEIKAIHERLDGFAERVDKRLDRIETNIDRLIQLYLDAETTQPAARRAA